MNPKSKQRKPIYRRQKVKIRFAFYNGRIITPQLFLKGILPALWDEADREQAMATANQYVVLLNETTQFFYPFAVDLYKTRLIDIHVGYFSHYPWDMPTDEIYPRCRTCCNWDNSEGKLIRFLVKDWGAAYLCPDCCNVVIPDPQAEKAGVTHFLTRKQFKERFGVEASVADQKP